MDPADGRVITNFINQALKNEDLTIYGDGRQTRSFCFINDLLAAMTKYMALEERFFGPLNLGNPEEFTVSELAQKVLKLIPKSKSKIVYRPLPVNDPEKRRPDISQARQLLGWEPKTKLEEGLEKTIKYYRLRRETLETLEA